MISVVTRSARVLALVALAALAVTACGGSSGGGGTTSFKGTKKIGMSTALTGTASLYGHAISQGTKLAVDDINAKGGVNSYKLEMDIQDDAVAVDKATANVKQLILQDNVTALIGQVSSGQCAATSPIAKQSKVIMIAAVCNSWQLTTQPDIVNPYFVSVVPNTYMEGAASGTDIGKRGIKRIFIVSPKYLFGISETNSMLAALKKVNPGVTIVNDPSTWYVPFPTNPRWDSTIAAIQAAKPDLVYSNIYAGDLINFVKQATQVDPQFFTKFPITTLASIDELNSLGAQMPVGLRLYSRAPFFAFGNARLDDFVKRYHDAYNEWPSDWALMGYDAVQLYATAANNAKSFDSDKVRAQIVGKQFDTLRGGKMTIRAGDQQANVPEVVGTTVSSAGKYPFVVYKDVTVVKGDDIMMSPALVSEMQAGKCEKNNDPTTTDFVLCPSWSKS